jgi:hypothetical protein
VPESRRRVPARFVREGGIMNELRLPTQATSVTLQTALTRTLDAASAYLHAAGLSESSLLASCCRELAAERHDQAGRIAALIERDGGTADFGPSPEAGFQQLWMTLVNRRFPTFREGLPRECERCDLRLERVLLRLWNATADRGTRHALGAILREVRGSLARLHELRDSSGALPVAGPA